MVYFSRYIEVAVMKKTTKSSEVIRILKSIFARHGIPGQVRSGNGPHFDGAELYYFTRSPRSPQSNGDERGFRTMKNLLLKT